MSDELEVIAWLIFGLVAVGLIAWRYHMDHDVNPYKKKENSDDQEY